MYWFTDTPLKVTNKPYVAARYTMINQNLGLLVFAFADLFYLVLTALFIVKSIFCKFLIIL